MLHTFSTEGYGFGPLGFTVDLKAELLRSNVLLNDWLESQTSKADRIGDCIKTTLTTSQTQIDRDLSSLKALQVEPAEIVLTNGRHESSPESKISTKVHLLQQIRDLTDQMESTRLLIANKKQVVEDLTCVHSVHKDRVAESKRLKNDLQTSKNATVNDLTKGIINYKYSGLDFEKAEDGRLRFSFTQLDPNNPNDKFSFEIGVENDAWSLVNIQPVLMQNEVIERCVIDFNKTDDMTVLVGRMRNVFLDQLVIQSH